MISFISRFLRKDNISSILPLSSQNFEEDLEGTRFVLRSNTVVYLQAK